MNRGPDLTGQTIGAYRIDSLIGAGGYSRVYRGVDERVGREAAIKVLLPAEGDDSGYSDDVMLRFEREARIVANLRDPHSVRLFEYGQTDDVLYMIFEFIEGQTLEDVRRNVGALPALRVVKILEQVLLSLEEAHTVGLVHRDMKPANIMLFEHIGRKDQIKVLDFGVGKSIGVDSGRDDITQAGMLVGTPRYMAPEQWSKDGEVSGQTDIYSLGLVGYELLTGSRAITATQPVHIMKAHIDDEPIELPARLDIPSGLRAVVNRMIRKDLDGRYDTAAAVLDDLTRLKPVGGRSDTLERRADELAEQHKLSEQAGPPTAERSNAGGITTGSSPGPESSGGRRRLAVTIVLLLACIGGIVAAFVVFGQPDGQSSPPTQPAKAGPDRPDDRPPGGANEATVANVGQANPAAPDDRDSDDVGVVVFEIDGADADTDDDVGAPDGADAGPDDPEPPTRAADKPSNALPSANAEPRPSAKPAPSPPRKRRPPAADDTPADKAGSDDGAGDNGLILYPADDE